MHTHQTTTGIVYKIYFHRYASNCTVYVTESGECFESIEEMEKEKKERKINPQEIAEWSDKLPESKFGFYSLYCSSKEIEISAGAYLSFWNDPIIVSFRKFLIDKRIKHECYLDKSGNRCLSVNI